MGLGISFKNLSSDSLTLSARDQNDSMQHSVCESLAPLHAEWERLLAKLPSQILSDAVFRGLDQLFRKALCESSLNILCDDLVIVANSAVAWEELQGFSHQILKWILTHSLEPKLQARAARLLRQIENRPDSIKEGIFFLADDLARHPVRAELVVGMGMAGLGMRVGRLAGAAFSRANGLGVFGRLATQASFGFSAELSGFSAGTRSAQLLQQKHIDWSASAIANEMLVGLSLIGPMKLSAPLARVGRATGAMKFLQAGTAHYLGAASGTYASALVQGQTLNGYQIFSGATHLMMEGAMASSTLKAGLPRLEAAHRALEVKTHQMTHHSFSHAAARVKAFWQRPLGKMDLGLNEALAIEEGGGAVSVSFTGFGVHETTGSRGSDISSRKPIVAEQPERIVSEDGALERNSDPLKPTPEHEQKVHFIKRGLGDRMVEHFARKHGLDNLENPLDRSDSAPFDPLRDVLQMFQHLKPSVRFRLKNIPEAELLEIFASEELLLEWIELVADKRWSELQTESRFASGFLTIAVERKRVPFLYENPNIRIAKDFNRSKSSEIKLLVQFYPEGGPVRLVIHDVSGPSDNKLVQVWKEFPTAAHRIPNPILSRQSISLVALKGIGKGDMVVIQFRGKQISDPKTELVPLGKQDTSEHVGKVYLAPSHDKSKYVIVGVEGWKAREFGQKLVSDLPFIETTPGSFKIRRKKWDPLMEQRLYEQNKVGLISTAWLNISLSNLREVSTQAEEGIIVIQFSDTITSYQFKTVSSAVSRPKLIPLGQENLAHHMGKIYIAPSEDGTKYIILGVRGKRADERGRALASELPFIETTPNSFKVRRKKWDPLVDKHLYIEGENRT